MAKQRKYIVGFMHVCMINDWQKIVSEQIHLMRGSGLYEAVNVINVGALGDSAQLEKLENFITANDKLRLATYSPEMNQYEFHTLRYMKDTIDRNPEFYGFYVHTKGVSYPGNEGGKYWRDYMNHYNLWEWRRCVEMLDRGYDTCGVKLINKGWPMHYSGNFFWFNGEYAQRLVDVDRMNLKDRFNAEMWICSGKPIAGTLCQMFVDYNTKGVFGDTIDDHEGIVTCPQCGTDFKPL